jgi:TolC family type I secretion outer membrane protein
MISFLSSLGRPTKAVALVGVLAVMAGVSANAETLEEALARAYETNPTLLAQRAQLRAVDEGVPQALSGWRPTVSVTGDVSRQQSYNNTRSSPTSRYLSPYGASLDVTQPLYNFTTSPSVSRAENQVLAERAALLSTEQQVMQQVIDAYTAVLRDQAIVELNSNNERVLRRQLDATNDRFRVGEVTRTDVSQAQARLAQATADRVLAEGNLAASRAVYRNVVGDNPDNLAVPAPLSDLPSNQDETRALAVANNPDVKAAEYTEIAARDNVRAIEGELWPELNLVGSVSADEHSAGDDTHANSATITAELSVPLYTAGSVAARVRAAKHTAEQRREQLDQSRRDAMETATRSWEALETARASLRALDAQIRSSQIALEGVQKEALVGSRTVLDVLNAEQELLNARVNQVVARRDEVSASYQLKAAVGALTARDLGLQVQLYDDKRNYNNTRGRWWGTDIEGERK